MPMPSSTRTRSRHGAAKVDRQQEQLQDALKQVDDAIEQLDQGTYGICQSCHAVISPERLEAMPASLLCIKCASRV